METKETDETSSPLTMIDTHCHLDDAAFAGDLDNVLGASRAAGVKAWILIGYAPDRWAGAAEMASRIPGLSHSLGVHPSHAQEWSPDIEVRLREELSRTGAVAVGEFGLDFYRDNAPFEIQQAAMRGQLRIARELGLPAVFHMRDAEEEMLQILEAEETLPEMVFHSYDGSDRLTSFVLEHCATVGVGGLATRRKSEALREQLKRIPLELMVLETDSPYLVPARQKDRRNVPAHVQTVARFLSEFFDVPLSEVAATTTRNAQALFGRLLP
jgi:TatD DNase family protein